MKKTLFFITILISMFSFIPKANAMQIYIEIDIKNKITLEVESSDTIEDVKTKIKDKENILSENQILIFNNTILQDGRTLADYNIYKGYTINLILKEKNKNFKVIFDANGGIFKENNNTITIEKWKNEDEETLEIPTREGYIFKGYYTKQIGGTSLQHYLAEAGIDQDITFYARWEKNSITIPEINNPKTGDNIKTSNVMFIISLISLIGTILYLTKMKVF